MVISNENHLLFYKSNIVILKHYNNRHLEVFVIEMIYSDFKIHFYWHFMMTNSYSHDVEVNYKTAYHEIPISFNCFFMY